MAKITAPEASMRRVMVRLVCDRDVENFLVATRAS
jgi:hypothetical protein